MTNLSPEEIRKTFLKIQSVRTVAVSDIVNVHVCANLNSGTLKEIFETELAFRKKHPDILFDFKVTE